MSQIYKPALSGPIPPQIPTSFVTDSGTAVPSANILNVNGGAVSANNNNGISTSGSANNLVVQLTNRFIGSTTTIDAVTANTGTLILSATPEVVLVKVDISGFRSVAPVGGVGFSIFAAIRTDGVTATVIGTPSVINHKDDGTGGTTDLTAATATITASGNNVNVSVTGILGSTIDWFSLGTYIVAT